MSYTLVVYYEVYSVLTDVVIIDFYCINMYDEVLRIIVINYTQPRLHPLRFDVCLIVLGMFSKNMVDLLNFSTNQWQILNCTTDYDSKKYDCNNLHL